MNIDEQQKSNKYLITQSNRLIEAHYHMTAGESKIILAMISAINPSDGDLREYNFKIPDLARLLNINPKNAYRDIEKNIFKLQDRTLYIPEVDGFFRTHWISGVRKKRGYYALTFHPDLKPYLLFLKGEFTKYLFIYASNFQSFYTKRIYELLKSYEKIGHRTIEVDDLRKKLGIEENKYEQFKDFRKWIINKAKKEFETKNKETGAYQSDITFDLETIRAGRKITKIKFIIKKQKFQTPLPLFIPEAEPITPAVQALVDHKISEKLARQFEAEQGEAEIFQCIAKYEGRVKAGKVEDTNGGYLLEMLKGRAGKKSKAEQDKENREKLKAKANQEKADQEALQEAFRKAQNKLIAEFLDGLEDEQQTQLITDFEASDVFKEHIKNSPFISERYKNEGVGGVMISPFYKRFIKDSYLPEEYRDIKKWAELNR